MTFAAERSDAQIGTYALEAQIAGYGASSIVPQVAVRCGYASATRLVLGTRAGRATRPVCAVRGSRVDRRGGRRRLAASVVYLLGRGLVLLALDAHAFMRVCQGSRASNRVRCEARGPGYLPREGRPRLVMHNPR